MSDYTFKVTGLSHEGRGIAQYEKDDHPVEKHGKKVFIRYALPDEIVQAKITHDTKHLDEADAIHIIEASKSRMEPFCEYYGQCGGCQLQHLSVDEQIKHKQNVLATHFQHFAQAEPAEWLAPIQSKRLDYRRRARIGIRFIEKTQQFIFGFRENKSNHLVDITQCPILDIQLNQSLRELKQYLQSLQGKKSIGHIELAMGDENIQQNVGLLIRETSRLSEQDYQKLKHFCEQKQWQCYIQPPKSQDIYRIDNDQKQKNTADLVYKFREITFNFAMSDFTQVNHSVNTQMLEQALNLLNLQKGERVLDLFCGLGNFSLPMAHVVGEQGLVVGIEGGREMVKRARSNASKNNLRNTQFFAQDLTQDCSKKSWAKQGFDAILIDPPRAGAKEVMQYLANFQAKRIVYISCNPATLARDSKTLLANGYRLQKAGIMDMFSHTSHVESIALFSKCDEN